MLMTEVSKKGFAGFVSLWESEVDDAGEGALFVERWKGQRTRAARSSHKTANSKIAAPVDDGD